MVVQMVYLLGSLLVVQMVKKMDDLKVALLVVYWVVSMVFWMVDVMDCAWVVKTVV